MAAPTQAPSRWMYLWANDRFTGREWRRIMRQILIGLAAVVVAAALGAQSGMDARLAESRAQIDGIDRQIVELLNRRAAVVEQIGAIKKKAGLPVAAPAREQQVLDRVVEAGKKGPLPPAAMRRIYQTILHEMQSWEESINSGR